MQHSLGLPGQRRTDLYAAIPERVVDSTLSRLPERPGLCRLHSGREILDENNDVFGDCGGGTDRRTVGADSRAGGMGDHVCSSRSGHPTLGSTDSRPEDVRGSPHDAILVSHGASSISATRQDRRRRDCAVVRVLGSGAYGTRPEASGNRRHVPGRSVREARADCEHLWIKTAVDGQYREQSCNAPGSETSAGSLLQLMQRSARAAGY
jgi:hypothetical protein